MPADDIVPQRILVATDGSPASVDAVDVAVELATHHRSELHVVHVVPALELYPPLDIDDSAQAFAHEPTPRDHAMLDDAAAVAASHGLTATTALLAAAGPSLPARSTAQEIVAYAEGHTVDLIVVGSRGHGALSSALLGSVSLAVMRRSATPVVIVRGNADATRRTA